CSQFLSGPASTPARCSCAAMTSAASPSTSVPASPPSQGPARCSSRARSRTSSPAQESPSPTAARTPSRASPTNGSSTPLRTRSHRQFMHTTNDSSGVETLDPYARSMFRRLRTLTVLGPYRSPDITQDEESLRLAEELARRFEEQLRAA